MKTTITISDLKAGTFTYTTTTNGLISITYITSDVTLTN